MKKYHLLTLAILLFFVSLLPANMVTQATAQQVATNQLFQMHTIEKTTISSCTPILTDQRVVGYVFLLQPTGYIVTTANTDLPPVLAYSTTSSYYDGINKKSILDDIIRYDLSLRINNLTKLPAKVLTERENAWDNALNRTAQPRFEQWPPEGYSSTQGWIKTNWTQTSPYNDYCPMDLISGSRSYAGCPSIAMGQIVNYYETFNGTVFTNADDYVHNYGGNNYSIDNDAATYGFPAFPQLNTYLNNALHHYLYQENITNSDKAAIVFACGVAAQQVYGSEGSGTFGVSQALQAYQRFNFQGMELLGPTAQDLYTRMAQNVMEAKPVHLAILTPANDAGHNVDVDGYNTNQYFHLNFGWGGTYNGWYLLPDEIPYGLTAIEGAIVDIQPYDYVDVQPNVIQVVNVNQLGVTQNITVTNYNTEYPITVEDYLFNNQFGGLQWDVTCSADSLPHLLAYNESLTFHLTPHSVVPIDRDSINTNFRIIFDKLAVNVPIILNHDLTSNDNHTNTPSVQLLKQNYPNPFNPQTRIPFAITQSGQVSIDIYNCKGQLVRSLLREQLAAGEHTISWDGTDNHQNSCPSGLYLYHLTQGNQTQVKRMVLIK